MQKRALAASGAAAHGQELPFRNGEIDSSQSGNFATPDRVGHLETMDLNCKLRGRHAVDDTPKGGIPSARSRGNRRSDGGHVANLSATDSPPDHQRIITSGRDNRPARSIPALARPSRSRHRAASLLKERGVDQVLVNPAGPDVAGLLQELAEGHLDALQG